MHTACVLLISSDLLKELFVVIFDALCPVEILTNSISQDVTFDRLMDSTLL